jgi:hypothetical protein
METVWQFTVPYVTTNEALRGGDRYGSSRITSVLLKCHYIIHYRYMKIFTINGFYQESILLVIRISEFADTSICVAEVQQDGAIEHLEL